MWGWVGCLAWSWILPLLIPWGARRAQWRQECQLQGALGNPPHSSSLERTNPTDPELPAQTQQLQAMLNSLDQSRKDVLAQMQALLGRGETLRDFVLQELGAWRERQRQACLGAPHDTALDSLEAWCTGVAGALFQLLRVLRTLQELRAKVSYQHDPLETEPGLLERRIREQLASLLRSAFVVEEQPAMPHPSRRQLVLRTNQKFSTSAAQGWGGCLGPRHPTAPLTPPCPQTSTLPVVVISNVCQASAAWASILWFNLLSPDPKDQLFFQTPPPAPWHLLAEALNWQFMAAAGRGLDCNQLHMLAEKLFGMTGWEDASPMSTLTWIQFSKDSPPGFSFWTWLDGILELIHKHLSLLWKDGLILGFVSKKRERQLLRRRQTGTFLLRFSESCRDGGITFTWVEHGSSGEPGTQRLGSLPHSPPCAWPRNPGVQAPCPPPSPVAPPPEHLEVGLGCPGPHLGSTSCEWLCSLGCGGGLGPPRHLGSLLPPGQALTPAPSQTAPSSAPWSPTPRWSWSRCRWPTSFVTTTCWHTRTCRRTRSNCCTPSGPETRPLGPITATAAKVRAPPQKKKSGPLIPDPQATCDTGASCSLLQLSLLADV
uniref:Signal transducer and activator of transcription 2 n=1 Tax=Crocodylus porosus TaxID=8502 RepID=A0A7M4FUJ1_CROPO